jgi:heme exporter protein B
MSTSTALALPAEAPTGSNPALAVLRRDLLLAARRRGEVLTPLGFFTVVVSLFPLAIGPEPAQLRAIAPGVLWVAALLSALLSLDRLFAADQADGTLDLLRLSPQPLALGVAAKVLAHWLVAGLPLVLLAPLLALQFDLGVDTVGMLCLSLLLGTPVLSLLGALGAALTLGSRGGSVLLALLLLPLFVPVLVFGAGAVAAQAGGLDAAAHLQLLGALLAAGLVLAPPATAAALRLTLD